MTVNGLPMVNGELPPGTTDVIRGTTAIYVNVWEADDVASSPLSVLVTTTFTAPAACAGVVAVIDVLPTTVTAVAAVPPGVHVDPSPYINVAA